mgnify:FL=1
MRRSPATAPGRRRTLFRPGCPRTCRGEGKRPAAVVWDECAPCTARHSERSGADCGKSLRGGGFSARDVPGPAGEREKVRQRSSGANVRPVQRGIPKGAAPTAGNPSAADAYPHGMSPDLPQGARERPAAADAGGCEKTAGSRKIDENLIFGTRAFVFYPLSLAAPKILRLNKIANKFAFVSGLFVSLRLKPKYANRP